MNEFQKLLNTDIDEIPEAGVTALEKKQLKQRITRQKKKPAWLLKTAIAAALLIGTATTAVVALPSIASQIPVLQNIVSYFEDEELIFSHFSEVAQTLDMTQTSNGSTVTLEEAVYDGTSVSISFALKTESDLGESPYASGMIEAKGANGYGAGISMTKVDDTRYAGVITMSPDFNNNSPNSLSLTWEPVEFLDAIDYDTKIIGDWSFNFKLRAIEGESFTINETIDVERGSYLLKDLSLTKLSTVLRFDTVDIVESQYVTDWQITDNLGNSYPMVFGTGGSTMFGRSYQQITFEAIDAEAETITIQPKVFYNEDMEDAGTLVEIAPIVVELE